MQDPKAAGCRRKPRYVCSPSEGLIIKIVMTFLRFPDMTFAVLQDLVVTLIRVHMFLTNHIYYANKIQNVV